MNTARITIAQIATVAFTSPDTIRNWIKRGDIAIQPPALPNDDAADRIAPGTGRDRLFTFRRAMNIILTAALVRVGMSPKAASLAALKFTDIGGGVAFYVGETPAERRNINEPFDTDSTVLIVRFPRGGGEPDVSVERLNATLRNYELLHSHGVDAVSAIVVDVSDIYARAKRAFCE